MSTLHQVFIISYPEFESQKEDESKKEEEKIKYTYGLRLYQQYTKSKDEEFKGQLNLIHPTKVVKDKFKIHYFDIEDKYWPAINNIIRHCEGILFAIKIDNYDEDRGLEFVREWMINLDDIYEDEKDKDKNKKDFYKVLIGVFEDENNVLKETRDKIIDYCEHCGIKYYWGKIGDNNDSGEINEAFDGLFDLIEDKKKKEENDNDIDEYDEKLNIYLNY